MEELNYILKQAKRFHYTNWDDSELKKCIDLLMDLTRQELITLYTSNSSINLSVSISFILSLSLPILSEKRSLNTSSFRVLL